MKGEEETKTAMTQMIFEKKMERKHKRTLKAALRVLTLINL